MNEENSILEIRFSGDAVDRGRVPVAHLVTFLSNWRKVLQRTGRVLRGEAKSVRRGQPPQDLQAELEFEVVSLAGMGRGAVMRLERRLENASFPEMDFGLKVLQTAVSGLKALQDEDSAGPMPVGLDPGVLQAWRDAGVLLGQGIEAMEFTLNEGDETVQSALTPEVLERIRARLTRPRVNIRKIQGRLMMVDFTGDEARCRVHPVDAEPIVCLVDEERKEAVLANMLEDVLITGEVREDPATGKITRITIQDIERHDGASGPPAPEPPGPPELLEAVDPDE